MEHAEELRIGDALLARLRSFIRGRVPSSADSDDVLQTVLLHFLERRAELTSASLPAWAFRVARVAIADLHRGRTRRGILEAPVADPADAEPRVVPDIAKCVRPLLATLPRADQVLLRRVDVDGASQAELAQEFGLSASGMKSRTQRARERLRAVLLASCTTEWDAHGQPSGDASCKRSESTDCGCLRRDLDR